MNEKYKSAIVAFIICGIVLVILSFLYFIINGLLISGHLTNTPGVLGISFFFTLVIIVLDVFTFFGSGLLSARLAARHILNWTDAAVLGAITAIVGELINLPFTLVLAFVTGYIWPSPAQNMNISSMIFATISATGQLICCFPVMLVVGIIISILGALTYAFYQAQSITHKIIFWHPHLIIHLCDARHPQT